MEYTIKEKEKVNKITKKFDFFKEKLEKIDYIHQKKEFFEIMNEFRRYIAGLDDRLYKVFSHSKNFQAYKDFFTYVHEYYLRSIESIQALSVMTQGMHNFDSIVDILDKDVMKESFERKAKELGPIDFSKAKNFVFAGCGPFPETMLYVYENTDIENILGLDYNHEAIYMAGELINGLSIDNIHFKHIDATIYDYRDADIVSIPLFVPKKSEVINQIIKTGKDTVQIMVTCPKGFMNIIYNGLRNNLTRRANKVHKEDMISNFVNEEIIKIEKYDF